MLGMILKMSAATAFNVLLTYVLWRLLKNKKMNMGIRILLGVIYGGCAIISTHYGVNYHHMMLNVRDLSPLAAGLFFDPLSGLIAGFLGGIERYIAGTYFGVGSYTRIACSVSTCLAGILSALMHFFIFKKKKPSAVYAYFIGSSMEVFHMYVVFITHRDDMDMAYYVVKVCSAPMIIFTGIGLALISIVIRIMAGERQEHIHRHRISQEEVRVSQRFQFWLFVVTTIILGFNLLFGYLIQTQSAIQSARDTLSLYLDNLSDNYESVRRSGAEIEGLSFKVGDGGGFEVYGDDGTVLEGNHLGSVIPENICSQAASAKDENGFECELFGTKVMVMNRPLSDGNNLMVWIPQEEVYADRDHKTYETVMADILLFTVVYVLISMLVQKIVVSNLELVNESLNKITNGNLDEEVSVYTSSEFASLSEDINHTVTVLKSYIEAAEKRIEQELEFARMIQESALPHNFHFPRDDFRIYAYMDPAKEVGGDFYDFFFVDQNKLCMVIADVSGKGIPASLFMMRSKTALRSFADSGISPGEIFSKANNSLCEGNEAEMFVTVWMGMLDLDTGHMVCANAGHEYPAIKRKNGEYELYKQKHSVALATMEDMPFREYELDLYPGDCLFVYTDGVPEAINEKEEEYGTDRMLGVMNANKDCSEEDLLRYVRQDIWAFVGTADQFDDVTMLGLEYRGNGGE